MINKLSVFLKDIKIEHTIFALPFAVMSTFLAAKGFPPAEKLFWIIMAMIGARSSAMAFNRLVDSSIDKLNARTAKRALPDGQIRSAEYIFFLILFTLFFVFATYKLNRMAFYLSPLALLIIYFYSFTKRFSSLSHLFLGIALSLAPLGGWIAIKEEISWTAIILGFSVIFWLCGLDIIYSCQDIDFDRSQGLFSIPRKYGLNKALKISFLSHVLMMFLLLTLFFIAHLGLIYLAGVLTVSVLLIYEHSIVNPDDLSKVNIAFFNVNGIISMVLMIFVITDCLWKN